MNYVFAEFLLKCQCHLAPQYNIENLTIHFHVRELFIASREARIKATWNNRIIVEHYMSATRDLRVGIF